jgi:multisubunit Na+/H+ antiporter MnhF subunit
VNAWLTGVAVLLIAGLGPAGWLAFRGGPVDRLIGVELGSAVTALLLVLFATAVNQAQYLIVPVVLVLVSFAGTLVYARLLAPRS